MVCKFCPQISKNRSYYISLPAEDVEKSETNWVLFEALESEISFNYQTSSLRKQLAKNCFFKLLDQ